MSKKLTSFKIPTKRQWPSFLISISFAFTLAIFYVNILIVSNIIWPGEPFHSAEIGLLIGIYGYYLEYMEIFFLKRKP